MREICTSGSVRGGDGNIPTYSAFDLPGRREVPPERRWLVQVTVRGEEVELSLDERLLQIVQE